MRTDDARNKAVCWIAGELAVLVSYCGLAELDGKTTDLWLATTLASLGKTPSTLGELMEAFPHCLEDAYAAEKRRQRFRFDIALEVIWSGFSRGLAFHTIFGNTFDGRGKPIAPNGNFRRLYSKPHDFPMDKGRDRCFAIFAHGSGSTVFYNKYLAQLKYFGRRGEFKPSKVVWLRERLVHMIRNVAKQPEIRGSVGANCMSSILLHSSGEPRCKYHPEDESPVVYVPLLVGGTTYLSVQLRKLD